MIKLLHVDYIDGEGQNGEEELDMLYTIYSERREYLELIENRFIQYPSDIDSAAEFSGDMEEKGWILMVSIPYDDPYNNDQIYDYIENFNNELRLEKLKKINKKL